MEIKPHKVAICGLQGSGKTYKAKQLIKKYKTLIISPHRHDWEDLKDDTKYYIKCLNSNDLEVIFEKTKKLIESKKWLIDGIVIDEFDMYISNNYEIKYNLNDFILNHRHIGVFLIIITRRPQDIPTKIFESCKFIYAFSLQGSNAKNKFNSIYKGWGDMIYNLVYSNYEYTLKEIGKPPLKLDKNDKIC